MLDSILVTGANGDIADAIGRILRETYPTTRRLGADLEGAGKWPGRSVFDEMYELPRGDSAAYIPAFTDLVRRLNPNLVIPVTEPELLSLYTNQDKIAHLPLLMNPPGVLPQLLNKLETARWLASIGLPVPITTLLGESDPNQLPLIIKPTQGRGSRGIEIVRSPERLAALKRERPDGFIAQELIDTPDAEFTCPILKCAGTVRTLIMRRWLSGGMTNRIVVEQDDAIQNQLDLIAENLPENTDVNVQLRVGANGPRVFEINPRLSGTTMMRHRVGFEDLVWWISAREGKAPPVVRPTPGTRVFRTYGEALVAPGV